MVNNNEISKAKEKLSKAKERLKNAEKEKNNAQREYNRLTGTKFTGQKTVSNNNRNWQWTV